MKKLDKIVITKEDIRQIDKSSYRKALVETGMYSRPSHKVHKSVKDYTRTPKHKNKHAFCD